MKKTRIWRFLMLMTMVLPLMTACGGDDDGGSGATGGGTSGGGSSTYSKRIAKVIFEEGGSIFETVYTYDTQNRVIKTVTTENSNSPSVTTKTYTYGETTIVVKIEENGTYNNGQKYSYNESHSYRLSNGLIQSDTEVQNEKTYTTEFTYDNNGYLASYSDNRSSQATRELTWSGGNLTQIITTTYYPAGGSYTKSFSYSNNPWSDYFFFGLLPNCDGCLSAHGYYGKMPKNLPSKIDDETYEYTLTDGYVTKIVLTYTEKGKTQTDVANITWE